MDIQVATEFHRAVLGFEQVVLRRRSHGYPSSEAVARGAIAAIEQDRGEVDAAELPARIMAKFGGVAPQFASRLGRRKEIIAWGDQVSEGLRHLR